MSCCAFCGKQFGNHETPMEMLDCLMGSSTIINEIQQTLEKYK